MKIHIHPFLFFILFGGLLFMTANSFAQTKSGVKNVKKLPVIYEYPVDTLSTIIGPAMEKGWIVYSDRNNNVTYTDSKIRTTFKNIGFLESFYVIDETSDLVEIIKYAPDMLESSSSVKIKAPSKVQYYGWIQKSKLLLSQKSFVENMDKRPLKWVTMLNGKKFFEKIKDYVEGDHIKVYDAPDLQTTLSASLDFNELVYVYKTYGDKVLIGKQTHFSPENSMDILLGWVPASFVQSWGQRICLEPIDDQANKNNSPLIYTTKEAALAGTDTASAFMVDIPSCVKALTWKKYPVFKIEKINKGKLRYNLFHTGAITSTFDKTKSFIYNLNGTKINYSKLCDASKSSKSVNIVFALNAGNDIREYLYELTNLIQDLASFFNTNKNDLQYHFAAVDCSAGPIKTDFTNLYSSIVPVLINVTQKNVEGKGSNVNNGISNGLTNASALFKGHEEETNIIVVISSKADTETRLMKESLYTDLGAKNIRFLFVQPYCGTADPYTDFTGQAKSIIDNTAIKIMAFKRNKLANNLYPSEHNKYQSSVVNDNNVSHLDFPSNAGTQGYIVFQKMNNKVDSKAVSTSLDTLLMQIAEENKMMVCSLQRVFNSSTSFNNSVNKTFEKYFKTQESMPTDLGFALNNVDYNYFVQGYAANPESMKPFKLSLLLSTEEYEDMYNMFKGLKLEQLNDQYDLKGRTLVFQEFSRLLNNYNTEHFISIPIYSLTFGDYFYKLFGFYSDNELLNKYKVYDLNTPNIINKEDLKKMIDYMNKRINSFYTLRGDTKNMFSSNGNQYYWVSEDYLP
jgi:hypothetical protein